MLDYPGDNSLVAVTVALLDNSDIVAESQDCKQEEVAVVDHLVMGLRIAEPCYLYEHGIRDGVVRAVDPGVILHQGIRSANGASAPPYGIRVHHAALVCRRILVDSIVAAYGFSGIALVVGNSNATHVVGRALANVAFIVDAVDALGHLNECPRVILASPLLPIAHAESLVVSKEHVVHYRPVEDTVVYIFLPPPVYFVNPRELDRVGVPDDVVLKVDVKVVVVPALVRIHLDGVVVERAVQCNKALQVEDVVLAETDTSELDHAMVARVVRHVVNASIEVSAFAHDLALASPGAATVDIAVIEPNGVESRRHAERQTAVVADKVVAYAGHEILQVAILDCHGSRRDVRGARLDIPKFYRSARLVVAERITIHIQNVGESVSGKAGNVSSSKVALGLSVGLDGVHVCRSVLEVLQEQPVERSAPCRYLGSPVNACWLQPPLVMDFRVGKVEHVSRIEHAASLQVATAETDAAVSRIGHWKPAMEFNFGIGKRDPSCKGAVDEVVSSVNDIALGVAGKESIHGAEP